MPFWELLETVGEGAVSVPVVAKLCTCGVGACHLGRTCPRGSEIKNSSAKKWGDCVFPTLYDPRDVTVLRDLSPGRADTFLLFF